MRDENGFKCHTQSESHVRQMLLIGEDSRKHISDYSQQFQRDFLQLLRTAHGEKKININHFYQEYISNKEHVHMNATRWPSLTEFAKWLGREGICRVEEGDKGLEVAWIDNSPEALRRQDAIRKKERQDRGDEEREQKLIREQVERARREADEKEDQDQGGEEARALQREDGEKIKLAFGAKAAASNKPPSPPSTLTKDESRTDGPAPETLTSDLLETAEVSKTEEKVTLKMGSSNKPKNVFAAASKKMALGGTHAASKAAPKKPMSEAERIMKEELERKRLRETKGFAGGPDSKRQRVA
jgi:DNA/RNA-binding protein KIN17